MKTALVVAQVTTFIALGAVFLTGGSWRLGLAQLFLAAVTVLVYS